MIRETKQRSTILKNLKSRHDHPTAEDVYIDVRKILPKISFGTVYRNLGQLANEGIISVVPIEKVLHFDYRTEPHAHFYCEKCKSVIDLDLNFDFNLLEIAQKQTTHKLQSSDTFFRGICKDCLDKQNN
ncbi:MAG: transcriptional repressor [Clostridia bacterium]|nr:transcriptional repressor [Clostridia bacterium]